MAISKVDFYGDTLIDISSDTVDAEHLAEGYTAHDAAGNAVFGTMSSSSGSNVVVTPDLVDGTKIATITVDDVDSDIYAPKMTILSYGNSTWDDFITAYNSNSVVYCRASSNSNPASGAQTRMAFMAYVNANPPTNAEFQYYRSVSTHNATQQGDQVYIYKLDKNSGWSVTVREAKIKMAAGNGLEQSFANNTLTIKLPTVTAADNGKVLQVVNGAWAVASLS